MLVSQNAFPVSRDSTLAISSLRERRISTALRRMRERWTGGRRDQVGNAAAAQVMAWETSEVEAVWTFARGVEVAGLMVVKSGVEVE